MPGKHKARIGRQSRAKRGVRGKDLSPRRVGAAVSNSARKLEDIAQSIDLLRRAERECIDCGKKGKPRAKVVVLRNGSEVWLCRKCADMVDLLPSFAWHDRFSMYEED